MPEREIEITIAPDGEVNLHLKGYKGQGCLDVARLFAKVVGEMKSHEKTGEFYEPDESVRIRQEQRQ